MITEFSDMLLIVQKERKELLLVDTGDRRIGHGLTDRLLPKTVNGQFASQMYYKMGYDAMVPGKFVPLKCFLA